MLKCDLLKQFLINHHIFCNIQRILTYFYSPMSFSLLFKLYSISRSRSSRSLDRLMFCMRHGTDLSSPHLSRNSLVPVLHHSYKKLWLFRENIDLSKAPNVSCKFPKYPSTCPLSCQTFVDVFTLIYYQRVFKEILFTIISFPGLYSD